MALDHSCQVQRHPLSQRGLDLYETPAVAVEALLRCERVPHCIWEPAAGRGAIVKVLRDHGHAVIASDIYDYGGLHFIADFLTQTKAPAGTNAVLTNPPFKHAAQFVAKALELCPRVFLLLRLAFLEAGELNNKRRDRHLRSLVLDGGKLARVYCFRKRLPMMHRADWQGKKSNSGMAFGWFCWDANHTGPTNIHRISWEETGPERAGTKSLIHSKQEAGMAKPKLTPVDPVPAQEEPLTIARPEGGFSLDKFKSKRGAAVANVETLPSALPVHNLAAAKDFARLHPDEERYWSSELCFVSVPIKGQKHDTLHLVDEDIAMRFLESGEILRFRLALASKPGDVFFLCEVPTQNVDNTWNSTNLEGCEQAKTLWTKLTSRKSEGVEGYQIKRALDHESFAPPKWPSQTLEELILRAFAGRLIDREDHPAILRKIGAKQVLS